MYKKDIVIFNVYRPPAGNVESFIEQLSSTCDKEDAITNKELIFLGDFNINYLSKQLAETKKITTWQNRLGLTQHIKKPTRVAKGTSSLIDLIFSNIEYCQMSGIIDLGESVFSW